MLWGPDGSPVATLQGHEGKHVWCLATHSATPGQLASGADDGAVRLWDLAHHVHWSRRDACVRVHTLPEPPPLPPSVSAGNASLRVKCHVNKCMFNGPLERTEEQEVYSAAGSHLVSLLDSW
jgi:hypothetical protein